MTNAEFTMRGKALYGQSAWQGQLADALGIDRATVWRYSKGKRAIPEPVILALNTLATKRAMELGSLT